MTPAPRRRLVPSFLATDSVQPTRNTLDRLTLLSSTGVTSTDELTHVKRRLVGLIDGGPLALAEVSARLVLPVSLVRALRQSDAHARGHALDRGQLTHAQRFAACEAHRRLRCIALQDEAGLHDCKILHAHRIR